MSVIQNRLILKRFLCNTVTVMTGTLLLTAAFSLAQEEEKLPPAEVSAKKAALEKDIAKTFKLLSQTKLQEARDAVLGIEASLIQIRGSLTKQEATPYDLRIDKIKTAIAQKEDSLVNKNLEILRIQGTDAAFEFMQDVAWKQGVSREKLDMIETSILGEAPAIEQKKESATLDRTVQQLENNQPTDPGVDPYILKTAQMIVQARADSVSRLQESQAPEEKTPAQVAVAPVAEQTEPPEPVLEPQSAVQKKPAPVTAATPTPEPAVSPEPAAVIPPPKAEEQVATVTPAPTPAPPVPKPPLPQPQTVQKPEEYTSPAIAARIKANQEFIKQNKANKEKAQKLVVELYNLIESGQNPAAFKTFREKREFLAKHISTKVFNVLEMTLAQNAIDAQKAANAAGAASAQAARPRTPEQDIIDRIEGLSRDNKVEAAYNEFKRSEPRLKDYMAKKEFKQLKDMVERSYKLRHGEAKKK